MFDDINNLIINEKKRLRKKSKDYIKNFEKIKNFIDKEVFEIENLKSSSNSIIPEIQFNQINENVIKRLKKFIKEDVLL